MELLIKEILKRKGISVKELSQQLGVTRDACYKYINGNPTIKVLDRIAKVLDVDVRSLINGFPLHRLMHKIFFHPYH